MFPRFGVRDTTSGGFTPETGNRDSSDVFVIIIGTDQKHSVNMFRGPEREGIPKRWSVAECQRPHPTSLTLTGSLVEGGACP